MLFLVIVNDEYLVVRKSRTEPLQPVGGSVGVALGSIPAFLMHHHKATNVAPEDDWTLDRQLDNTCTSRSIRKRPRTTSPLEKVTMLSNSEQRPQDSQPLRTTSSAPVSTGPGMEVSICRLPGKYAYTMCFHRRGYAIQRLLVTNCVGYWVADYCGIGSYQQVLLLPIGDGAATSGATSDLSNDNVIYDMLRLSSLTDGRELWLPKGTALEKPPFETNDNGTLIDSHSQHFRIHLPSHASLDMNHALSTGISPLPEPLSPKYDVNPPWLGTVENALEQRLEEQRKHLVTSQSRIRQQRFVLDQGKAVLQALSCSPRSASLELLRLEYFSQPNVSQHDASQEPNGISASILMEIDLLHVCEPRNEGSPSALSGLEGVHISILPATSKEGCGIHQITVQSGLIPTLKGNETTTLMVMVELKGVALKDSKLQQETRVGVDLLVQALWKDAPLVSKTTRRGAFLASLTIPYNTLLLPSSRPTTIEFDSLQPGVKVRHSFGPIYECRAPFLINVDLSSCDLDRMEWIQRLQKSLAGSFFRIESLHADVQEQSVISLVLYAFPSSTVHGLVHILKTSLPHSAFIVHSKA